MAFFSEPIDQACVRLQRHLRPIRKNRFDSSRLGQCQPINVLLGQHQITSKTRVNPHLYFMGGSGIRWSNRNGCKSTATTWPFIERVLRNGGLLCGQLALHGPADQGAIAERLQWPRSAFCPRNNRLNRARSPRTHLRAPALELSEAALRRLLRPFARTHQHLAWSLLDSRDLSASQAELGKRGNHSIFNRVKTAQRPPFFAKLVNLTISASYRSFPSLSISALHPRNPIAISSTPLRLLSLGP